jgi:hypothetical protein
MVHCRGPQQDGRHGLPTVSPMTCVRGHFCYFRLGILTPFQLLFPSPTGQLVAALLLQQQAEYADLFRAAAADVDAGVVAANHHEGSAIGRLGTHSSNPSICLSYAHQLPHRSRHPHRTMNPTSLCLR